MPWVLAGLVFFGCFLFSSFSWICSRIRVQMLRQSLHRLKPYLRRRIFLVTLQMSHFPILVPMQAVSSEGGCVVFSLLAIIWVTHVLARIFGWLLRGKVSFGRVELTFFTPCNVGEFRMCRF